MGKSPCQNCPYRKLTCHDHCEEYNDYHAALVEAKRELSGAQLAIDLLLANYRIRKARWERGHK